MTRISETISFQLRLTATIGLHSALYLPRILWLFRTLKTSPDLSATDWKVLVLLSSDTEFDPPSAGYTWKNRSTRCLLDGLPRFLEVCDSHDCRATFFSEGKLVRELPELFLDLLRKHEIGCHSFAHEWFGTTPPPHNIPHSEELRVLTIDQKADVLKSAIEAIKGVIGKAPKSFKAPFDSVDHPSTFVLLQRFGFDTDSSLPSFNHKSSFGLVSYTGPWHASAQHLLSGGQLPLVEVPYTVGPKPSFVPFREQVLMDALSKGIKTALNNVDIQTRIDHIAGSAMSMLHITTHPWEFSQKKPWGGGNGRARAKMLSKFLEELCAQYDTEFLTVSGFFQRWENKYCQFHKART